MNKLYIIFFLVILSFVSLLISCKITRDVLAPPLNLDECYKLKNLLFKYAPVFKEKRLTQGSLESICFDLDCYSYTDYDNIINGIPNLKDRDDLKELIRTKNLKKILIRDTTCISLLFSRDQFLLWYNFQLLIYHTSEKQPFGNSESNAEKCRLMPSFPYSKKGNLRKERLDNNWLFCAGKSHIGPPS